ncbi:MAG: TlpA family protein disulfide reductase [Thalassotalea sp.]
MKRKNLFLPITYLLALLLSSSFSAVAEPNSKPSSITSFEQLIAKHKGEVIYLDFWASWCVPCRKSFPWMNEMQTKYQAQGLKIITINLDSNKNNADEFLEKFPNNFEVIYDPSGLLAKKFKVKGMPNSFIIDRSGTLISAHIGFTDNKKVQYQQELEALLAK